MRNVMLVAAVLVAACTPASVQPTLMNVTALGYSCGDGIRDNEPSGLYQWHCTGTAAGHLAVIDIDGNGGGVAGITLAVDAPDPSVTGAEFRRLAAGITLLRQEPALPATLEDWSGRQETRNVGNARVTMECDATQCNIEITSTDGPLEPLRLP